MTGMYVRLLLLAAAALTICQADSLGGRKLHQFGDPGQTTCPIFRCKDASSCVYSSRTKAWQCKACIAPRVPNTRQTECVCPAGMYPVANGDCAPCKMNQFCPLGQSASTTTARNCPANTVTLKTGARSVNDCFNKPGYKYIRTSSGVRAEACSDDEYTVGLKKQTTCTKCMPGFKTDPANPPGIHTSSAVCVAPPGSFVAGDSVVPCPKGEYSDSYDSSTSCTSCLNEFGEGITTQNIGSTARTDCKWLERGYALVDDRKKVILTKLSDVITDNRLWIGAKPCPQNYYCRGGDPNADAGGQPTACPAAATPPNIPLWTEGEGAIAEDECVAPPGYRYDSSGTKKAVPCEQGQYKEGWNRLTSCDNCAGTTEATLLTGNYWLSDPTTFINKLDPNTGITMQQVAVRGSPENCYIQKGMGVLSLTDSVNSKTYLKAVVCPANSYGISGDKKFGRSITPCTACPTNMKTGMFVDDTAFKVTQINSANVLATSPVTVQTTDGYWSVEACATQPGYGYYAGSSQICPAGTYNDQGNKNPCTPCPFGTTTDSANTINVDADACSVYIQGYGLVNGATALCPVGTYHEADKDTDTNSACDPCDTNYITGDVGSDAPTDCTLCAAGFGDFDPLIGDRAGHLTVSGQASHPSVVGLTCTLCPAGYYGPASRTATPCLSCPTGRTYTYSWGGTDDVFSPLATSPAGSKDINDCVADMAQTVDGAFEMPLNLGIASVTATTQADNLQTCAQSCRDAPGCAAVTFDYFNLACYLWTPPSTGAITNGGVALKLFPSQNLAQSTNVTAKAMGNGQYSFWAGADVDDEFVPAKYETATGVTELQDCLDKCNNNNLCSGVGFGEYTAADGTFTASDSCKLIMAIVQPGNSRRSLIKAKLA